VLVAEDYPLNQMFIRKVLEKFGIHNFEIVENGAQAVRRYGEAAWDIILMDCQMPVKSGYDATLDIRTIERGTDQHVKIVAMTANAMVGERDKCLRHGMDDYISKPIDMEELKDILGHWLKFDTEEAEPAAILRKEGVPVDLSALRAITGGDRESDREFLTMFVTQADQLMQTLRESGGADGHERWKEAAHKLKGGSGGIGAFALQKLCDEAQHFGGPHEARAALFRRLEKEYAQVRDYLQGTGLI
jgi:polar amino acid transport system substrate-binding protein